MEVEILQDLALIFALSIIILFICNKLKIPSLVGFFLTGIILGPSGFAVVDAKGEVEAFAEVGVMLLLFTIGIEFSLERLLQIKRSVLIAGPLQVVLTVVFVSVILGLFGYPFGKTVFIGCLVALSSTAIVLKDLQEKAQIDSPHGRMALGILIFQDLSIVIMILAAPFLAGKPINTDVSIPQLVLKTAGFIVFIIICAKWAVPKILYQIVRTRSRELFLLGIAATCIVIAWITSIMGLSLALGAFLAGIIISESEYSHQAIGDLLPFRDLFSCFFFISIGMLLDIGFMIRNPVLIISIGAGFIVLKAVIASLVVMAMGYPARTSILSGFALAQIGEFSFILSGYGIDYGILTEQGNQIFLSASALSMAATPLIISAAPLISSFLLKLPMPERLRNGYISCSGMESEKMSGHLVIIGYGVNGRNLSKAALKAGIPYMIIDMNPETVRREMLKGEHITYGDATHEAVLSSVNIKEARIAVVAINDPVATRRVTEHLRRMNPKLYLIVRTIYANEMKALYDLGANQVIPEEFETAVEIFVRVLSHYLVPRDEIEKLTAEIRADGYEMFRSMAHQSTSIMDSGLDIPDAEISTIKLPDSSFMAGKTLIEIDLRKNYGVTIMAVRRSSGMTINPDGDFRLNGGDVMTLISTPEKLTEFTQITAKKS
jgi:CPA2 family monovalent cation:H+ antiporter-2